MATDSFSHQLYYTWVTWEWLKWLNLCSIVLWETEIVRIYIAYIVMNEIALEFRSQPWSQSRVRLQCTETFIYLHPQSAQAALRRDWRWLQLGLSLYSYIADLFGDPYSLAPCPLISCPNPPAPCMCKGACLDPLIGFGWGCLIFTGKSL